MVLIGAIFTAVPGWPVATVPWLYEVAVPVESQSAEERRTASADALLVLLSRLSGLAYVPRSPEVRAAIAAPESYYSQFRFATTGPGELDLVVQFDQAPVQDLVKRAQLPIWHSMRERALAWVVVQPSPVNGGERELLGAQSESAVAATMLDRARARGLPLTLPLLDLEDRLNVSEAAVWGRLTQVLEPAAARYGADIVLIGRAEQRPDDSWTSEWVFWLDGQEVPYAAEGADLAEQAATVVDLLATELAVRRAVLGRAPGQLLIAVSGVRSAADYGALMGYFKGLEFIESVGVAELNGDRLLLQLSTPASADQLLKLFGTDGRLFSDQLAMVPTADLSLVWRRR